VSHSPYDSLNLGRGVGDEDDAVAENLRRFADEVGYRPERLYEVTQVHGAATEQALPALDPLTFRLRHADAIVATSADCPIAIRVADCVPLLLADPASGAVAAVHAGWRGIVAGVLEAAVRTLAEASGAPPSTLVCAIFPSIGAEAFEVGEEVATQLVERVGEPTIVRRSLPRPHVDLARGARLLLATSGLLAAHIEQVAGCTYAEPARFFSHRRDAGRTGRHLAVILPRC